jgi:mono/diheme cytochrome c family protein
MWTLTSRRHALLAVVLLLLALDLGRSLYARVGYSRPTEVWQPDPKLYADIAWPPGSDLPENTAPGAKVFAQRCAVCHGPDGRGNGPAAATLIPRPRDFTLADFRYRSTAPGSPPSDSDLISTVSNGLAASAMPGFKDILSEAEIWAVVVRVKDFSNAFVGSAARDQAIPARSPANTESLARGKGLYQSLGCAACHGEDGRKRQLLADQKGYPLRSRDLTAPWTFRRGSDPKEMWLRIGTGLGPMPSYATAATPEQIWDVVNYVTSLARIPPWESGGTLAGPGYSADKLTRGDYLVHAMMCGLCHNEINRTGIYRTDDALLAGGMRVGLYPDGLFFSRNLTSDPATGLGQWSDEQVANAIRNGRSPTRTLNVVAMPWNLFHALSEDDALAIATYLKSMPAVRNAISPPLRFGLVETVVMKFTRPLPSTLPMAMSYADGNFGNRAGTALWLPEVLVWLQWGVLIGGAIVVALAAPKGKRTPKTVLGWAVLGVTVAAGLLVALVASALFYLPALPMIPPQEIAKTALGEVYVPKPGQFGSPEHKAMLERGRYLYTVASCALCHEGNGAGGAKVSWRPFGSLWVRNLTSDRKFGLGSWSDDEIARAIRSGISRDGRQLHWQGMTWDFSSNWDEEDIRSLVAFLRTLPALMNAVSHPFPPAVGDCETYTYFPMRDKAPKSGCFTTE